MKRMRKSIIWMAAFMFCCGAVFAQKAERKNVREGNKLYETEKFTEAEIAYRKSLEVNPRSSEGTYNLGNALYKQKKFPEAAEQYQLLAGQGEKMIETPEGKARLAEIYHNVGNIGMQSKEYAKSVEAYKQSLRLNPKDDETRYNLALAQKLLHDQQNQQNEDQNQDQNEDKKEDQDKQDQQQQNIRRREVRHWYRLLSQKNKEKKNPFGYFSSSLKPLLVCSEKLNKMIVRIKRKVKLHFCKILPGTFQKTGICFIISKILKNFVNRPKTARQRVKDIPDCRKGSPWKIYERIKIFQR